jgi:hypothetical protein
MGGECIVVSSVGFTESNNVNGRVIVESDSELCRVIGRSKGLTIPAENIQLSVAGHESGVEKNRQSGEMKQVPQQNQT